MHELQSLPPSSPVIKAFHTNWVAPNFPPDDLVSYILDYTFNKIQNVIGFTIASQIWNDTEMGALQRFRSCETVTARMDIYEPSLGTFPIVVSEIPPLEGTPVSQVVDFNRSWYNFSFNSFWYYPAQIKSLRVWIFVFDPLFNAPVPTAIQLRTTIAIHVIQ